MSAVKKGEAMRSDREGLEDTRCCDMKPETGIFSPSSFHTVETAGEEGRGGRQPKLL